MVCRSVQSTVVYILNLEITPEVTFRRISSLELCVRAYVRVCVYKQGHQTGATVAALTSECTFIVSL